MNDFACNWTTSFTVTGTATLGDRTLTCTATGVLTVLDGTGTTSTGFVFDTDGNPLKGVTASIGTRSSLTDETGRFLIRNVPPGDQILLLDGTTASTATAIYPVIPFTVRIVAGTANVFDQTIYYHKVDRVHFTPIVYPNETIAIDPRYPDFALKIPAGVSIKDWQGSQVDKVGRVELH